MLSLGVSREQKVRDTNFEIDFVVGSLRGTFWDAPLLDSASAMVDHVEGLYLEMELAI